MPLTINPRKLIHTERGRSWLSQFDPMDQEVASAVANNLTLVSHNEFERGLTKLLTQVSDSIDGTVALFAMREVAYHKVEIREFGQCYTVDRPAPYFENAQKADNGNSVVPLSSTADIGSEGRIASIIRQFCKRDKAKFLNHPTVESMREKRCDAVIFVDDLIGTGSRATEFLSSFWAEKTLVSWHSYGWLKFHIAAYSGTEKGISLAESHKSRPEVHIYRDIPTFYSLPWSEGRKEEVFSLCRKYGMRANKKRKHMWLGYKKSMCSLVFEHGCPNNVPGILVEESGEWTGLFPDRIVEDSTNSIFPSEISEKFSEEHIRNVGQKRLAESKKLARRGELGLLILTVLALIAKSKRKKSTLCFATGFNSEECERVLSKCINWGFITAQIRITSAGLAELKGARSEGRMKGSVPDKGTEMYYPQSLRKTI
ncbi:MAG: hypothetical protein CMF20_08450 [Idiomarinaceae bacterium]|nr:hypothetical protein [Idiomarinaceae bacterium]